MRSTKREVSPEHLATFYHLPLHEVAQRLGICTTALKKLCRRRGIDRWPYRRLRSIQRVVQRKTHKLRNASVTETLALQRELEELSVQRQTILSTLFYPPSSSSSSSHRLSDSDSDDHADVHENDKDDSDSDEDDVPKHHSDVRARDPLRSLLHVIEGNGRSKGALPSPPVPNSSRFAFPPPSSSPLHHGLSYNQHQQHHHQHQQHQHQQQQAQAPTAFSSAGGIGHHAVSGSNEPRSLLPPSHRPVDLLSRQQHHQALQQQQQQQYLEQQHYQHYQQQHQHAFQAPQAPAIPATHFSTREMKNPTQHREPSVSFPPAFPQTQALTHSQAQGQGQTSNSLSGSFGFPTALQATSSKMTPQAMSRSPAGSLSPHFSSSSFWSSSSSSSSSSVCSPGTSPLMPESPMVTSLPPPASSSASSHSVLFPALSLSVSAGLGPAKQTARQATLPSANKTEEVLLTSCSTGGQYKLPDWFNEDRQKYLCLHLAD